MKLIIQSLLLISTLGAKAIALPLKSGDIILQPTSCYLCGLIEEEENTPYSHMGILILKDGVWDVLEAWGEVRITTLTEFLSRKKPNSEDLVIRTNENLLIHPLNASSMLTRFKDQFQGLSYDDQFLWNNRDQHGEKMYCSEFVAKFIAPYLLESIPTKPMHYDFNRADWVKYFHGTPPDGKPGISPGDFERSPLFHSVGKL